jgi:hypothetical protein
MKSLKIIIAFLTFISFTACEEVMPPVDFTETEPFIVSTYVINNLSEPAQDKMILIEDLTGVRCPNCPDAAKKAKQLKTQNPDRIVTVGLYTSQPKNLTTPHSGDIDLRTEPATNLYTNIYNSPPLPGGGVNRKLFSGQSSINQSYLLWGSSVQAELALKSKVNLSASLAKENDSTLALAADITFMEALAGQTFISVMLLENDLEAVQSSDTGDVHDYVHEHVLRAMYTPYNGAPLILDAEKGRYLRGEWSLEVPKHINLDNASVVILINLNAADNKEVLQCEEVSL